MDPAAPPRPPAGLPDDALLDAVSRAALDYFWGFAHPVSGMARERSGGAFGYDTDATVTTGGTGFGLMALVAGAARGWLARDAVAARIARVVAFLEAAERHHGVFPHFMDGATGATIPFSPQDDGGDLVETAFLVAGLLAARGAFAGDAALVAGIDRICRGVEWSAHLRPDDGALMWHRSARHPWAARSLPIRGWNECLITYVLAAGSPTHPIPPAAYHDCWAKGDQFVNGHSYHGIRLPLGPAGGGPMFLSHYSFLGLDPRGLVDRYADYGAQTRAHARINHAHCCANPLGYPGYGPDCWGLSASDSPGGYDAHSPTNDLGVISPTAAVASLPYLPAEAMRALRHFVEVRGDALWGRFGLVDAFCPGSGWVAPATLAIDQGPIVVMIENHRSGLIWQHVMAAPEVADGLRRLGFRSPRSQLSA
ncbi:MAG: glucoamylase family protein [Thermohalobaculum sp.]|nr:glucoamylase family protein [Thermohalobaculum sp.]